MQRGRTHQESVEAAILHVVVNGRAWTTGEITAAVKRRLPPSAADAERADERPNETKYDQVIANALEKGRNLCRRGYLARLDRGVFQITSIGAAAASNQHDQTTAMVSALDELFPEDAWQ